MPWRNAPAPAPHESSKPRAVPTLPTSSASSSRRLTKEEAAKALGLKWCRRNCDELWFGGCFWQPCQCAWVQLRKKHRSRSCYFFRCGLPACHLSQLCVANSQAMLSRWPLCIQATMVLQLPNSLLLKATVQSKSKQFFLTCCCRSILLARSQPREWRSDLQLFLRQTNLQPQKQLQCILKKVQAQEKKKKWPPWTCRSSYTCWHGLQHHDLCIYWCCCHQREKSLGRDSCFEFEIPKNPMPNSKAFWRKQSKNFWKVNL